MTEITQLHTSLSLSLSLHSYSHVNRITQYENPVSETKRKFAGAQLINMRPAPAYDDRAPPPLKAPPSFQSTAALEKQREAEAAVRWPDAGLRGDYTDSYPYPYPSQQMPTEHDLESGMHCAAVEACTCTYMYT